MLLVIDLLNALLPLLFGLAAVAYVVAFIDPDSKVAETATPLLALALGFDLVFLLMRYFYYGRYPILTAGELLSFITFALGLVYFYLERIQKHKGTGVFVVCFVLILQILASTLLPHMDEPNSTLLSIPLLGPHTMTAVLSYSAFALGAIYAGLYLLLHRALKKRNFGLIFERLPSLDVISNLSFWAILVGWIFLTLTLFIGTVMSLQHIPGFYKDPKFIATFIVWCVYALTLSMHFFFRKSGRRMILAVLISFVLAVVAYAATSALGSSFHTFAA